MDSCELKSPASQESGIGTILIAEDSLGSLEELTEGVHEQLTTHMDHTRLLQYELELLRAQLAEKNKQISVQQLSIKQLQDAIAQNQRDSDELKRIYEAEITAKCETINVLQLDLTECQHQYAECYQQVVNQDCHLSELRDENAILLQKISYLESQLRKRVKDTSTQTESLPPKPEFNRFPSAVPLRHHPELRKPDHSYRRSVQSVADFGDYNVLRSPPPPPAPTQPPTCFGRKQETVRTDNRENKSHWIEQFQDLMSEIRHLQEELNKPAKTQQQPVHSAEHCACQTQNPVSEIWKTMAQERQHRVQLDHNIQMLQLELIDVKNKIQNVRGNTSDHHCCVTGRMCCVCASNPLHTLV